MPSGRNFPRLLLRDQHLPHRLRSVGVLLQFARQSPEPPVHASFLDALERLAVHPAGPAVAADRLPGDSQHVLSPHLVAQRVEPEARISLRFHM